MNYESRAQQLAERILALIPSHPEILELDNPWGLFNIGDFYCDDLNPSLAQASCALTTAKARYAERAK